MGNATIQSKNCQARTIHILVDHNLNCRGPYPSNHLHMESKAQKSVHNQTLKLHLLNKDLEKQRQNIANAEAFKDQILNNIHNGIITFDLDFMITSCNAKASDILNISKEMILNFTNHSHLMKNFEAFHQEQNENNRTGSFRILVLNEENEQKVISYSMHKMFNSEDIQTGYLLSMNDETEKKTLEKNWSHKKSCTLLVN